MRFELRFLKNCMQQLARMISQPYPMVCGTTFPYFPHSQLHSQLPTISSHLLFDMQNGRKTTNHDSIISYPILPYT